MDNSKEIPYDEVPNPFRETPPRQGHAPSRHDDLRRQLKRLEKQVQSFQAHVEQQLQDLLGGIRESLTLLKENESADQGPERDTKTLTVAQDFAFITEIHVGTGGRARVAAADDVNNLAHLLVDDGEPATQSTFPPTSPEPESVEDDMDAALTETAELDLPADTMADTEQDETADFSSVRRAAVEEEAQIMPDSDSLANVDPQELRALLKRKAQAQLGENLGSSTLDSMRTRRLVLSPDELEELQRTKRPQQRGNQLPGAETSQQAVPRRLSAEAPKRMPYPEEIDTTKRLMFSFKAAVHEIVDNQVIPGTSQLISREMRDELTWYSRLILEDFLTMHERQKARAQERYDMLISHDPRIDDPALFWDREAVEEYGAYRTITYLEKFLDQLEGELREHDSPNYYLLIDYLAELFELERLSVEVGETTYTPDLHELSGRQPPILANQRRDKVVVELVLSGYRDVAHDQILRKAIVIIGDPPRDENDIFGLDEVLDASSHEEDSDETEAADGWMPVMQMPDVGESAPPPLEVIEDLDHEILKRHAPDQADVPLPDEVRRCQSQIFSLKIEISTVCRQEQLPKSRHPMNEEITEMLNETINTYLRAFLILHNSSVKKAQDTYEAEGHRHVPDDPTPYWPAATIRQYRDFRTTGFILSFLDKLESRINSRRLRDHQELIDHLAQLMDLGRLGITPGITLFDPDKHELVSSANLPPNADLRAIAILAVIKSGYTDLATGKVARKAMVTVKLKGYSHQHEMR